ncbi:hypothetical protein [Fulvimarina sp. MAC8]|uniref:hypothetical protein n=1 Tax=Fulvimarina sp. MAC8 TaxID=3162874 RepID=UPI0032EDB82E
MNQQDRETAQLSEFGSALSRKSVIQSIAEKIAALISSGDLFIGNELPSERDMAQAWQVSGSRCAAASRFDSTAVSSP